MGDRGHRRRSLVVVTLVLPIVVVGLFLGWSERVGGGKVERSMEAANDGI
jgi:hypothetical protein